MSTQATTPKPKLITAITGYRRDTAESVLSTSINVFTNFFASPYFTTAAGAPPPPVDQATMKASNDALQAMIAAAATGAKQAITARNHAKDNSAAILDQLAIYVKVNSKGDMNAFVSSGFTPKSSTKNSTPPVSESIKKIAAGPNAGEMLVTLMRFPGAASYQLQWGVPGPGGTLPTSWISMPITSIRSAILVSNLTPGTTYVFQARAVVQGKYSDWGDPIARIAV